MFSYQYLTVIACAFWAFAGAGDLVIPLASYCQQVHELCTCDPQANLVRIHCREQYAMMLQITDTGTNIAMSYYATESVHWLPQFNVPQVANFEFDAYTYWSETFFKDLLDALGVQETLSINFRDRSLEYEMHTAGSDNLFVSNVTTWFFSPVNNLTYFKYKSKQAQLQENIFYSFDNLTNVELRLTVEEMPTNLFQTISHSLETLFIENPNMFQFDPAILQQLQQLRSLTLRLSVSAYSRQASLQSHSFVSMPNLEELRLMRATSRLDTIMFSGSYNLRFIIIIDNPDLIELPSDVFQDQGNLTELDLSWNALSKLPMDVFRNLGNLNILNLSGNSLASLSSELFTGLTSLCNLILNKNPLTALESTTFMNVPSLKMIDMLDTQFYGAMLRMPFEALVCTDEDMCQYKSEHWECDAHCICWVKRKPKQLIVDCRGADLQKLPDLPQTTLVQTVLKLKNNSISQLPNVGEAAGIVSVVELYMADNQLSKLDAPGQLPGNLSLLDVRRNRIGVFDRDLISYLLQENNSMSLILGGNPLICDCGAMALLEFVRAQPQRVFDIGDLYCANRPDKPFQQMDGIELCPSYVLLIGLILGGLVIFICLVSVVYLIYQQELKIWLYNHNFCLSWISEEELDKDKTYDAFISYSHKDEHLIAELLPQLENGLHSFRVCLHGRDWLVGDCIPEQIVRTVNDSKRVIIVLSQHFIDSVWARMEFRIAYQATLQDKRKRIIIILYKELEHFEGIDSELRAYLKLNTYLKWGDPHFWSKLRYAMPHNRRVMKGQKKHAVPII